MSLEVNNLSKQYIRGDVPFYAVKDISLEAHDGEFIAITGKSGSGKSTLLNLIAALLIPSAGEVRFDRKIISNLSDKEASLFRNTTIGYIPQGQSLLANLTVLDNVRLPYYFAENTGNPDEEAANLLKRFGIEKLANAYPSSLSGGEARRASVARALINKPRILLADEPTGDLDAENTKEIIRFFREIANEGTTVIMVTHEADTTKKADTVYVMENGELHKSE